MPWAFVGYHRKGRMKPTTFCVCPGAVVDHAGGWCRISTCLIWPVSGSIDSLACTNHLSMTARGATSGLAIRSLGPARHLCPRAENSQQRLFPARSGKRRSRAGQSSRRNGRSEDGIVRLNDGFGSMVEELVPSHAGTKHLAQSERVTLLRLAPGARGRRCSWPQACASRWPCGTRRCVG